MMTNKKFAIFILTHGRPDKVLTYDSLRKVGYTGDIYLVIDNEDKTADQYYEKYGTEKVLMFDKKAISETFDTADTSEDRRAIVYARNASQIMAKELGYEYMLQLDDDYSNFYYKYPVNGALKCIRIKQMDRVLDAFLKLLDDTGADSVAMCQGGDLLGGISNSRYAKGLIRKAMNSFFIRTDKPVEFLGRINEDVNTYVVHGGRGKLFLTAMRVQLVQIQTQKNSGGMTDLYLASGTYLKSFFTVIMAPSCVSLMAMGTSAKRIHHKINWECAVPKILSPEYKKPIEL